jgi:hypothetical protein
VPDRGLLAHDRKRYLIRTLLGSRGTPSVTVPVARWTHAVATRALVVPPARGARRMVSRPAVHTALARSTLAVPRGALPAEPTVRPWRQLCGARRRQQHDQTPSQNETLQHRSSCTPLARVVVPLGLHQPRLSEGRELRASMASVSSSGVPMKRNGTSRCRRRRRSSRPTGGSAAVCVLPPSAGRQRGSSRP